MSFPTRIIVATNKHSGKYHHRRIYVSIPYEIPCRHVLHNSDMKEVPRVRFESRARVAIRIDRYHADKQGENRLGPEAQRVSVFPGAKLYRKHWSRLKFIDVFLEIPLSWLFTALGACVNRISGLIAITQVA